MATMITEIYDALLAAKVPEPEARKAAEALSKGDHDVQFAKVNGRLDLLTWMVGVSIALNIAVLIKLFAI